MSLANAEAFFNRLQDQPALQQQVMQCLMREKDISGVLYLVQRYDLPCSAAELTQQLQILEETEIWGDSTLGQLTPDIVVQQMDNFLSLEDNQAILAYAIASEGRYSASEIIDLSGKTHRALQRQSRRFDKIPQHISERLLRPLRSELVRVAEVFGKGHLPLAHLELELTAHNDRDFYKLHRDNNSSTYGNRELSFVYYCCAQPKPFAGGELCVYCRTNANGYDSRIVSPENNRLVFFPSTSLHEVLPVVCPSQEFVKSRFTLNGWITRRIEGLEDIIFRDVLLAMRTLIHQSSQQPLVHNL